MKSETDTIIEIWEAVNNHRQAQRRVLFKKYDITANQFKILQAVAAAKRQHAPNQQFLVSYTGLNKMVVSQMLDVLTRKKLLWRIRAFLDTRKYTVRLGAKGKLLLKNITPELEVLEEELLKGLTYDDRLKFEELLLKLKA